MSKSGGDKSGTTGAVAEGPKGPDKWPLLHVHLRKSKMLEKLVLELTVLLRQLNKPCAYLRKSNFPSFFFLSFSKFISDWPILINSNIVGTGKGTIPYF